METHAHEVSSDASSLPDRLWQEMRGVADEGLSLRSASTGSAVSERVRGEIYLFIVDLIAREVDRLELEPRPRLRRLERART